ncbi:MAG: hypothetical protein KDC43_22645, partial [Saprospiraceae bacterium]|nr:hypothetical protein [Saprospiraceae bacterium]
FPSGVWSGPGVSGSNFNPLGLSGPVVLTFTPNMPCTDPATTTVTVDNPQTPALGDANICETDGILSLIPLQDPAFPIGVWSGPGVSGSNFDPLGLSGPVVLLFTPSAPCTNAATTTVTVSAAGTPVLGTTTLCQTDGLFSLSALVDPLYPGGVWSGPGVSGNNFNPLGLSGSITLTFTPAASCAQPASTAITVNVPGTPDLGDATLCETDGLFSLAVLQDPAFPSGTWSGPGVSGNTFNPLGLSGPVNLLFTPSTACTNAATATITVNNPQTPVLGNANICETDGPFNLISLQDPAFPNGTWAGPGVSGNTFDPAGLLGPVNLLFTPSEPCTNQATTTITVSPAGTPILGTTTLCQSDGPFSLSALADPSYPGGIWSGPGVSGNTFNPLGLSGDVTLTFTPAASCALPNNTTVTVDVPQTPILGTTSVCEIQAPISLTGLQDPGFPNGTWSGPGVFGNTFDPLGLGGPITLVFTSSTPCTNPASTTIDVTPAAVPNLGTATICENEGLFDLTTLNDPGFPNGAWSGPGVTNNALDPSGLGGPITVVFTPSTGCAVAAATTVEIIATQGLTTLLDPALCPDESIVVNGTVYDSNNPSGIEILTNYQGCDSTVIVELNLLSNSQTTIDDILCVGESLIVNGMIYDEANPSGTEMLPAANGCDSIIIINLTFNQNSSATVAPTLCEGESIVVNGTVYDENNPGGMEVLPAANGCDSIITIALTYLPNSQTALTPSLCPGESITVNGTVYNQLNPSGMEVLPAANGCDSIVTVSVILLNNVTENLQQTLCAGESLTINGTVYDESNPGGVEIMPAANGCDSILFVSLTFTPDVQVDLSPTLCTGQNLTVNGTIYDENNPSGVEVLAAANGCDSIINVSLLFLDTIVVDLSPTLCTGSSLIVNGTVYDEGNPSGSELLMASNGCDSLINVNLSFLDTIVVDLAPALCPGESIVVNGTVYDENNPSGAELMTANNGCDSLVNVNLSFNNDVTFELNSVLCSGESLLINGTVYDENNPSGLEVLAAANGCDSTVLINLSFNPDVQVDLSPVLCPGESITVNGTVYDQDNPAGVEVLPTAAGCDSIIFIQINIA